MDYNYFLEKLGNKFNIVNGDLVVADDGQFTVTNEFKDYSIYLNPINKTWSIIAPKKSYIARTFNLRRSDCLTLNFEWLDDHYGTDYSSIYKNTSNRDFYRIFNEGLQDWYSTHGFTKVDTPEPGDTFIYAWKPGFNSHVATYLGDNKILHHVPGKLSSIDTYNPNKVLATYRLNKEI